MDQIITYYGKSGKDYQVSIPPELNEKLMALEGAHNWCLEHGPEQYEVGKYYFSCVLPKGHDCPYHLSLGTDHACAIWPAQLPNVLP